MNLRTVSYSDIQGLPLHEQMFAYADGYRSAAVAHCRQMIKAPTFFTWPNASAVLMLTAHAIELFLKGAILKRNPAAKKRVLNHHSIDALARDYELSYPEQSFNWDFPFKGCGKYPKGFTKEQVKEIETLKKLIRCPSILYRYPADKDGKEWRAILGFEPRSFQFTLKELKADFRRIKRQLK